MRTQNVLSCPRPCSGWHASLTAVKCRETSWVQGHVAFVAPVLCSTGAFVSSTTTFVSFLDHMVYSIISNFIWHAAVHMLHMSTSTAENLVCCVSHEVYKCHLSSELNECQGLRRFCCSPTIQQPDILKWYAKQVGKHTHHHFLERMWIR